MLFTELKTQNNEIDSILEESHWVLLIPDPMDSKFSYALELVNWIWDQSLLTVEINTITRVLRPASQMSCKGRRHDYPRSIVTDHYLLD